MEVVITALHYIMSLGMIKMIAEEHAQGESVGGVLFRLCPRWAHTLTAMDM